MNSCQNSQCPCPPQSQPTYGSYRFAVRLYGIHAPGQPYRDTVQLPWQPITRVSLHAGVVPTKEAPPDGRLKREL